jgi:glycosyltransferase involved in cell wall biosynthesis
MAASLAEWADLDRNGAQRIRPKVAVVIPCYRVRRQIGRVLRQIGPEVSLIYCVDDGCPEQSGEAAKEAAGDDPRFHLIVHERNQGVGAAVVSGYKQAIRDGAEIIVKLDGDGQMDPAVIPELIEPLVRGEADYAKGNRFFRLEGLRNMPWARLVGNAGLSFLFKLSTGYWHLFDPTNGYTAIYAPVARALPLEKLSPRYFFESDILFRLNTLRAVVADVPMNAHYGDEKSSLKVLKALIEFPVYHARNLFKRLAYNYFLRNFSMASINLILGLVLVVFGVTFGVVEWVRGARAAVFASPGTVMLSALPVILGTNLLLGFVSFDMASIPRDPIYRKLRFWTRQHSTAS